MNNQRIVITIIEIIINQSINQSIIMNVVSAGASLNEALQGQTFSLNFLTTYFSRQP